LDTLISDGLQLAFQRDAIADAETDDFQTARRQVG
jgi:hypothetical protein